MNHNKHLITFALAHNLAEQIFDAEKPGRLKNLAQKLQAKTLAAMNKIARVNNSMDAWKYVLEMGEKTKWIDTSVETQSMIALLLSQPCIQGTAMESLLINIHDHLVQIEGENPELYDEAVEASNRWEDVA